MMMTDDLVDRLRELDTWVETAHTPIEAAERIEALTADNARLRSIGTEMAELIEGNYYLPGVATRWRAALNAGKADT